MVLPKNRQAITHDWLAQMTIVTDKQARKFWTKVAVGSEDECWIWSAHKCGDYGQCKVGSVKTGTRKNEYSHRVAYEIAKGPIPAGQQILHLCDVKLCCNPAHLEAGTCSKNHKDAWARGLRRGTKLGAQDVNVIRSSPKTNTAIARDFGINRNYVSAIRHRKVWVRDNMAAAGLL